MLIPSSSNAGHVCSRGEFALALLLSASAVTALAQTEGFRNTTAPGWQLGDSARLTAAQPNPIDPRTRVVQGSIEKSNVRPILEIGRMIEVTRAYTTLANLMSRNDELRRSAIERLADVPM